MTATQTRTQSTELQTPALPRPERSSSGMIATTTPMPSEGLDPAKCVQASFSPERQRAILNRALEAGMTLNMDGHSVRLFVKGSEIVMDGLTPIQANVPCEPSGNVTFEATEDWFGLEHRIDPPAVGGCGSGYLGLGWNREQVIQTLMQHWTPLDYVITGANLALQTTHRPRTSR